MKPGRRGRGEGAIYQRGDGLWVGSVSFGIDAEGKGQRRAVYGGANQGAREKLQQLVGTGLVESRMGLGAVLDFWLVGHKARVSAGTVRGYGILAEDLKRRLGHVPVSGLTPFHVQNLYVEMAREGKSVDHQRR